MMVTTIDWSKLPLELLQFISKKVSVISDYASFRSVCTSWRSAANPQDLPRQLPWRMLPPRYPYEDATASDDATKNSFFFYSLSESKLRQLHLPETHNKACYSACHGWLLVVGDPEIFLLHPLTRAHIPLPPRTAFPAGSSAPNERIPILILGNDQESVRRGMERRFLDQAVLSSNPATSSAGWAVMVSIYRSWKLAFWRPGDPAWNVIDHELVASAPHSISYSAGKFFVLNFGSPTRVLAIDVGASPAEITPFPPVEGDEQHCGRFYWAESAGELFLIARYEHIIAQGWVATGARDMFHVLKMEGMAGERPSWSRVHNIGDQALFLSHDTSLSVSASDFPVGCCRPNCIYYDGFCLPTVRTRNVCDIGVFDMKDTSVSTIPCNIGDLLGRRRAAWILPTLC